MRELYLGDDAPGCLATQAQRFVYEGRAAFHDLALADRILLDQGSSVLVLTWLGDAANEAIACLLTARDATAFTASLGLEVQCSGRDLDDAFLVRAVLFRAKQNLMQRCSAHSL
jgi:ATP-dependent Lhr-like helicase